VSIVITHILSTRYHLPLHPPYFVFPSPHRHLPCPNPLHSPYSSPILSLFPVLLLPFLFSSLFSLRFLTLLPSSPLPSGARKLQLVTENYQQKQLLSSTTTGAGKSKLRTRSNTIVSGAGLDKMKHRLLSQVRDRCATYDQLCECKRLIRTDV
jgi:hypothetical protein